MAKKKNNLELIRQNQFNTDEKSNAKTLSAIRQDHFSKLATNENEANKSRDIHDDGLFARNPSTTNTTKPEKKSPESNSVASQKDKKTTADNIFKRAYNNLVDPTVNLGGKTASQRDDLAYQSAMVRHGLMLGTTEDRYKQVARKASDDAGVVGRVGGSSVQGYASGLASGVGTQLAAIDKNDRYNDLVSRYGKAIADKMWEKNEQSIDREHQTAKKLNTWADNQFKKSNETIEKEKEGRGAVGRFLIDAEKTGIEMGLDGVVNALTLGTGGLPIMAVRASGNTASSLRTSGKEYTDAQIALYGSAAGMVEMLTEKMFGGASAMRAAYGKGAFDLAERFGTKAAARLMAKEARATFGKELAYNIAKLGGQMAEEGFEEIVADIVEPLYRKAILGEWAADGEKAYDVKEILRDGLLGGFMALAGGGAVQAYANTANGVALSRADFATQARAFNGTLEAGLAQDEGSNSYLYAKNLSDRASNGGQILGSEINDLARMNREASGELNRRVSSAYENDDITSTSGRETVDNSGRTVRAEARQILGERIEDKIIELANSEKMTEQFGEQLQTVQGVRAIEAIAKVETGTGTAEDITTILSSQTNREMYQLATGESLPARNDEARAELETAMTMKVIANKTELVGEATRRVQESASLSSDKFRSEGKQVFGEIMENFSTGEQEDIQPIADQIYLAGSDSGATVELSNAADVLSGLSEEDASYITEKLTSEQIVRLYNAGVADARSYMEKANRSSVQREGGRRKGRLMYDKSNGKKLSKSTEKALYKFARHAGIQIVIHDTISDGSVNGHVNGYYVNGVAHIAMDADRPLASVVKHEVTHYLKQFAPKQYQELQDFVFKKYYESSPEAYRKAVTDKVNAYRRAGVKGFTINDAKEEILADATDVFFTTRDQETVNEIISFSEKLGHAIKDAIKHVTDLLSQALDADVDSKATLHGDFVRQLGILREAEAMWINALEYAARNEVLEGMEVGEKTFSLSTHENGHVVPVVSVKLGATGEIAKDAEGKAIIKSGKQILSETMTTNGYTADQIKSINTFFKNMGRFMRAAGIRYETLELEKVNNATLDIRYDENGEPISFVMSAMVNNGEYEVNFDFSTICKKREAMQKVFNALALRDDQKFLKTVRLTSNNIARINDILRKEGFETACPICFVESKRYNIEAWANKFVKKWNKAVKEVNSDPEAFNFGNQKADLDKIDFDELEKSLDTYKASSKEAAKAKRERTGNEKANLDNEEKIRELVKSSPEFQKTLTVADLITPEGIKGIKALSPTMLGILQGHYGTGTPKLTTAFTPYANEIALLTGKDLLEEMYEIGGVRTQSFSDFLIQNTFDYMQMIADCAARRFPAHAYTKEIAFAKIFGLTGMKINLSVVFDIDPELGAEWAGLDKDGNYLIADSDRAERIMRETGKRPFNQSIRFAEAVALQRQEGYSKNIGIIGVGLSDRHIRKMLGDNDIRYIIPYHSSSLPKAVKVLTNIKHANDYTGTQNTLKITELKDSSGKDITSQAAEMLRSKYAELGSWRAAFEWFNGKVAMGEYTIKTSKAKASVGDFDVYADLKITEDPKQTAENYISYALSNGWLPQFYQFADHENYYKLGIFDFDPYDTNTGEYAPQEAVQNIYPAEYKKQVKMDNGEKTTVPTGRVDMLENGAKTAGVEKLMDSYMSSENERLSELNGKFDDTMDEIVDMLVEHAKESKNTISKMNKGDLLDFAQFHNIPGVDKSMTVPNIREAIRNELAWRETKAKDPMLQQISDNLQGAKLSVTPEVDAEYLELAKDPKKNRARLQEMVDRAAESVGYVPATRYHGTWDDFNKFNRGSYDGARGIWFAERIETALGYGTKVKEVFLYMGSKPKVVDADYSNWISIPRPGVSRDDLIRKIGAYESDGEVIVEVETMNGYENEYTAGTELTGEWLLKTFPYMDSNAADRLASRIFNDEIYDEDLVGEYGYGKDVLTSTDDIVKEAFAEGYTGVTIKNVEDGGDYDYGTDYIVYNPSQIKSSDPVTYDDNGNVIPLSQRFNQGNEDIRWSLSEDSEGNKLTKGQEEFFKDSKVRDENGKLLKTYHWTARQWDEDDDSSRIEDWFTFDIEKANPSDVAGFYFASDPDEWADSVEADETRLIEAYLNIKNPYDMESNLYNMFTNRKDRPDGRIFRKQLIERGYDGVRRADGVWIAFYPEQIKLTTNENPTESEDIRYSIGNDMVNYNSTAYYTEDRIDNLIDQYASKSSPNYSQGYVTRMSPRTFLRLTTDGIVERNRIIDQSRKLDTEELKSNRQPIYLRVNTDTGEVEGHEGRHRMVALQTAGVREVPVVIVDNREGTKYNKTKIDNLTLKGQFREFEVADVHDLEVLSYANRETLIQKFSTPSRNDQIDEDLGIGQNVKFSIRTEEPPKNTKKGYKVFFVKDGKLYPPMVANPNGADTPVGVWLDADIGTQAPDSKTGRKQVKAGGKGTQGGSGSLAFRPGWHLGEVPRAAQFDRTNPETGVRELFPKDFVWAECEIAADVDYQEEAMSYGYNKNGKFQHSLAGLPKLPKNGYYKYRTNPNPDTVPWLITGSMKVTRLLGDTEVNQILEENGLPPVRRQGGDKTLEDLGLGDVNERIRENEDVRYSMSMDEIDQAYEDAMFDGDDDAALELIEEVARRKGYKYRAYHHTENRFTVFDRSKARATSDIQGFYFSADPEAEAEYGSLNYDVFLKMEKPYIVDSKEKAAAIPLDLSRSGSGIEAREWLQKNGYDSVIRKAEYYGASADEYIVFEPEQIKSAEPYVSRDEYGEDMIPLSERFDETNEDIRYSVSQEENENKVYSGNVESDKINESGEIRYSLPKGFYKKFPEGHFKTEKESGSEANRLAILWAKDSQTLTKDQRLISYNDRWYIIEKFDDDDLNYQIMDQIPSRLYKRELERIKHENNKRRQSVLRSVDRLNKLHRTRYKFTRRGQGADAVSSKLGRKDNGIRQMGRDEARWRTHSGDTEGSNAPVSSNQQDGDLKLQLSDDSIVSDLMPTVEEVRRITRAGNDKDVDGFWKAEQRKIQAIADARNSGKDTQELERQLKTIRTKREMAVDKVVKERRRPRQERDYERQYLRAESDQKIANLKAENRAALKEERDRTKQRISQMEAERAYERRWFEAETNQLLDSQKAKLTEEKRKAVERKNEQIEGMKEQKRKERATRKRRKMENDLLKISKRMSSMKMDNAHRELVDSIIGNLDVTSKAGMKDSTIEKWQDYWAAYEKAKKEDPNFILNPAIEDKLKRLKMKHVRDMSDEEISDTIKILQNIEHTIKNEGKFIRDMQNELITDASYKTVNQMRKVEGIKLGSTRYKLDKIFVNQALSPIRFMRRITGYQDSNPLYQATLNINEGGHTLIQYEEDALRPFNKLTSDKKFMDDFTGKKAKAVKVEGYVDGQVQEIEVTQAMRVALVLHSYGDDNIRHIGISNDHMGGGAVIPNFDLYKKGDPEAYSNGTTALFTREQFQAMYDAMSDKEKDFLNLTYQYFNETSKNAINKVSLQLYGYELAEVENYFPIRVDSTKIFSEAESLKFDGSIEGAGYLKERVSNTKPMIISDANLELQKAIQNHAKFVGLAIPIHNFNLLWKAGASPGNADVIGAVKRNFGTMGTKYVEKMLTDLQSRHVNDDAIDRALNSLRSKYAGAVLNMNLSVALKQAASYPTAMAVVGKSALVKALASPGKVDTDLIAKYTPLYAYRARGYSSIEQGDMKGNNSFLSRHPKLNWIQAIDLATTRKLWRAAEIYVKDNNKSLTVGTDAYYKEVAQIYNRIIEETQPNYTTMQRPEILRSDSSLTQAIFMFKTQPYQNFNSIYDAWGNAKAKADQLKRGEISQEEAKKANRAFWNAFEAQITQLFTFAAMTSLWNVVRRKFDDYEDDEKQKMTFLSWLEKIGKDMLSGLSSMFIFGDYAYEGFAAMVFGDKLYDHSVPAVETIDGVLKGMTKMGAVLQDTIEFASGDYKTAEERNAALEGLMKDSWKSVLDTSKSVSQAFGIPEGNVINLYNAGFAWTSRTINGNYYGDYMAKFHNPLNPYNPSFATSDVYDLLYKAQANGDTEAFKKIEKDARELGIIKPKSNVKQAMENRAEKYMKKKK